jgi:hypothetical protein
MLDCARRQDLCKRTVTSPRLQRIPQGRSPPFQQNLIFAMTWRLARTVATLLVREDALGVRAATPTFLLPSTTY